MYDDSASFHADPLQQARRLLHGTRPHIRHQEAQALRRARQRRAERAARGLRRDGVGVRRKTRR